MFEKAPNLGRLLTQDDWKRTQIRMPQEQYQAVADYAQNRNLSLNSAMLELMEKGLTSKPSTQTIAPSSLPKSKSAKKYIFTEWRYTEEYNPQERLEHNEKARMAVSAYLTRFFTQYPEHELVKLEMITSLDHKNREVLDGIRIWYTY